MGDLKMFRYRLFLLGAGLLLVAPAAADATLVESWQFNDTAGTALNVLANDVVGGANFTGSKPQVTADGAGALKFTVGLDASDNVFRNATLASPNNSTGVFELAFSFLTADFSGGGAASGANVGFGARDESGGDLFLVRLQETSADKIKLQVKTGSTSTLNNFGVGVLSGTDTPLNIRAVFDLDTDLLDVFWTIGAGAEQSSLGIAIPNLEFDQVRLVANTNTDDWGAADSVTVDYLTVSTVAVPEPSTFGLWAVGFAIAGLRSHRRRRLNSRLA